VNSFLRKIVFHPYILPIYPGILLIWFYQDVFISREAIFTHDSIHWYGTFNYFVQCLLQGSLPLWDPYSYSGAPYYLNHNIVGMLDPTLLITIPIIKKFDLSILDLYHFHYLARLLIFYIGAYALYSYVSKNHWAALFGSTFLLWIMAPNSFWQHGSTIIVSYAPFILLFILKVFSPDIPPKSRGIIFIASCYMVGLSLNLYIPNYLFVFITLTLIYLFVSKKLNWEKFLGYSSEIGPTKLVVGILIFLFMAGPFLYSLTKLLPAHGEIFNYTRVEMDARANMLVHTADMSLKSPGWTIRASLNNLASILIPGPDYRFFTPNRIAFSEIFFTFGFAPLLITILYFKKFESQYKGLFLFLLLGIGLLLFHPHSWYKIVALYPGAGTIRQFQNFIGFFLLTWGGLVAIAASHLMKVSLFPNKHKNNPSLRWLAGLFFLQLGITFSYLSATNETLVGHSLPISFLNFVINSFTDYGWILLLAYLLCGLFLIIQSKRIRTFLMLSMAGLTLFQIYLLNIQLKPYVIQPGLNVRTGYIHYDQNFTYNPIRVPFVPRHTTFWGFLDSLYKVPTAIPTYVNTYMNFTRRAYDHFRFISADRQKIISGIGTRRFGFFDKYTVAETSSQALDLMRKLPLEKLRNILVLEEDPVSRTPKNLQFAVKLKEIKIDPLSLPENSDRASHQHLVDFYDRAEWVDYSKMGHKTPNGGLKLNLPLDHPAFDWPWERKYIGFFQVLFGGLRNTNYYNPWSYYPNPGIRTGIDGNRFCHSDLKEWAGKHVMPGFYNTIYDQYPFACDISVQKEGLDQKETGIMSKKHLIISPEMQGVFYTDDIPEPYKDRDHIITGFSVASLDPSRVSPDQSPYPRDEQVSVRSFSPNKIIFAINNKKPGFFYYADSFAEDWEASICYGKNCKPAHIYRANFNFKAVHLPHGNYSLTLKFNPSLYIFLFLCFIVVSIPGMLLPILALKVKRTTTEEI